MTMDEVSAELRRLRRAAERSQGDIPGLSTQSVSRLETKPRGQTRFESLAKYAEALGYELVLQKRERDDE